MKQLLQQKRARFLALLIPIMFSACQNGFKPSDIYPSMPPGSKFERKITTIWGQTEVIYSAGPAIPNSVPATPE